MRLPYVVQGAPDGVPVVLVHAVGESWRSWERLLPLLPEDVRAYAVTMRGHGDADKPPDGYDVAAMSADVVELLDTVGVERAVLAGTSSGGLVAQQVAVGWSERVSGLLLVGAPRSLRDVPAPAWVTEAAALTDPVGEDFVRESVEGFWVGRELPRDFVEHMVEDGLRVPAHVWRAVVAGLLSAPAPTATATIRVPAVVLWGEHDEVLPRADQESMVSAIPGARLVVYPDTGHLVLWERPQDVARELRTLVDQVREP